MRKSLILTVLVVSMMLFACAKSEKKPFGAENIDYDKVEGINKDGPTLSSDHSENTPPMADKVIVEKGPWHEDQGKVEPTADKDAFPDYGDVPIFEPEHKD